MRAFVYLTVTILVAIGIGVAVSASSWDETSSSLPSSLTNGSPNGSVSSGGITATSGQVVDFPVMVQNNGAQPATLLSATLLPVPGFPMPSLVHPAVLDEHEELVTATHGWPVRPEFCAGHQARCYGKVLGSKPLPGFLVLPHGRHGPGPLPYMIEYAVVGSRIGQYGVAGIALTYEVGDTVQTVRLYEGSDDCVQASVATPCSYNRFFSVMRRLTIGD
ncbi:MAG: hypothetical protein ABSG36_15655 [Acidimicrobiales bacterium]